MLKFERALTYLNRRTYKNFGHKRQPIPTVTTLWHGFLTLSFIGLGIEWKRISKFIFGGRDIGDEIEASESEHAKT